MSINVQSFNFDYTFVFIKKLIYNWENIFMVYGFQLFWTFGKTIEQLTIDKMATYKYVLDFQKLLRPDDSEVELKCQKFHQYYEYCRCPLLRNSLNPHVSILNNIYIFFNLIIIINC